MKAFYNKDSKLIGWVLDDKYVWDSKLNYVAFIMRNYVFSADTSTWIGGYVDYNFLDKEGYPVAHEQTHKPKSTMFMISPPIPLRPAPPTPFNRWAPQTLIPPAFPPLKGWSKFSWEGWLAQ